MSALHVRREKAARSLNIYRRHQIARPGVQPGCRIGCAHQQVPEWSGDLVGHPAVAANPMRTRLIARPPSAVPLRRSDHGLPGVQRLPRRYSSFPRQEVAYRAVVPCPTTCGADAAIVQRFGDAAHTVHARSLDLPHNGQDVR
jgi:hypothetical protein